MFRLAEFLQSRGFKDINYDILTRPDQTEWSDHLNRVSSSLLRTFPERAFLFPVALIHTYLFTLPPSFQPSPSASTSHVLLCPPRQVPPRPPRQTSTFGKIKNALDCLANLEALTFNPSLISLAESLANL